MKAIPQFDLTFRGGDALSCLAKTGSAQFLDNNKRLQIQLPAGHLTDSTNCAVTLQLDAKIAECADRPGDRRLQLHVDLDVCAADFRRLATVPRESFGIPGGARLDAERRRVQRRSFATGRESSFLLYPTRVAVLERHRILACSKGIQLALNIASFRAVRVFSKLTITATVDQRSDELLLLSRSFRPQRPSGIIERRCITGNRRRQQHGRYHDDPGQPQRPSGASAITFKVTTRVLLRRRVPAVRYRSYAAKRASASSPFLPVPAPCRDSRCLPSVPSAPMRNASGVGPAPTTASQDVELFVGDFASNPNVKNIPLGPNHAIVRFSIRKAQ